MNENRTGLRSVCAFPVTEHHQPERNHNMKKRERKALKNKKNSEKYRVHDKSIGESRRWTESWNTNAYPHSHVHILSRTSGHWIHTMICTNLRPKCSKKLLCASRLYFFYNCTQINAFLLLDSVVGCAQASSIAWTLAQNCKIEDRESVCFFFSSFVHYCFFCMWVCVCLFVFAIDLCSSPAVLPAEKIN